MPKPAESSNTPPSGSSNQPPINLDVDEQLHSLWVKYGQTALLACGLVLLFFMVKMGWDFIQQQREASVEDAFAAAKTPDELRAFAADHPGHRLAGVADVELADEAYASGQAATALIAYQNAIPLLKDDPLGARARLGAAMAEIQTGQAGEGETALRALFADTKQLPALRAEAGYQLASLAAARGQAEETRELAMELMRLDGNSPWARKALMLRPAAK